LRVVREAALRVVIADDSVLLRAGLERLLADAGAEVVASVGDAVALLAAAEEHRPDVAIVDVRMPPRFTDDGLRAAIELRRRRPGAGVLVLSQYVEERYAQDLFATGARGVGYLLKDRIADVGDFVAAVRRVAGGGAAIDPEVVAQVMARRGRAEPLAGLTPREREVLALMAEGRTNAAIAEALAIGVGAVEKHVGRIFVELDLQPDESDHRRVLAVLAFLRGGG
jgi:DNA-binding NarL/FixJ family response regulator